MKLNKTYLFIVISSIALCIVIAIQVVWVLRTAQVKNQLFNEKANMVLAKTVHSLSNDSIQINNNKVYLDEATVHEVDSLLQCNMKLYDIRIDYKFIGVGTSATFNPTKRFLTPSQQPNLSQECIAEVPSGDKGYELVLSFPDKQKYIIAEMGLPFITSILLILIVLIMSWRTILSLQREKKLSEHTTEFLNNMTHEFKTPLTNIALAGKMIAKETNLGEKEKVQYYSGIILDENEKLRLQVEQVLSMTALERGEIPIQKTWTDLHQLIKDAVRHMGVQIENTKGKINIDLKSTCYEVHADRTHLMNALYNLIDNAIKYSDKTPEISIETFDEQGEIVIVIKDNGPGISKEYQDRVFDKYFRIPTGNLHDVKGFGLGLAYVKQVVQLYNGSISMDSIKDRGTKFTIKLPNG